MIAVHVESIIWGLIATGVTAMLSIFIKILIQYGKQMKSLKYGMLWLQHDRLLQACKFYLKQGSIDADELENLEGLYNSYKILGGNGTISKLYNRVTDLNISEE